MRKETRKWVPEYYCDICKEKMIANVPRMNCRLCGCDLCRKPSCNVDLVDRVYPRADQEHICRECYDLGETQREDLVATWNTFKSKMRAINVDWQKACDDASKKEQAKEEKPSGPD